MVPTSSCNFSCPLDCAMASFIMEVSIREWRFMCMCASGLLICSWHLCVAKSKGGNCRLMQ